MYNYNDQRQLKLTFIYIFFFYFSAEVQPGDSCNVIADLALDLWQSARSYKRCSKFKETTSNTPNITEPPQIHQITRYQDNSYIKSGELIKLKAKYELF